MDKNLAWVCKDFIIPQQTFSLCNTETTPKSSLGRPGKSFEKSSDKFKKRKVAELELLTSSSNELLFASSCKLWKQGRRKDARVVRNLSKNSNL